MDERLKEFRDVQKTAMNNILDGNIVQECLNKMFDILSQTQDDDLLHEVMSKSIDATVRCSAEAMPDDDY